MRPQHARGGRANPKCDRAPLRRWLVAAAVSLVGVGVAEGATEPPARPAPLFPKHSFTLDTGVACTAAFDDVDAVPSAYAGVNYFVLDNLSLGAQAAGHYVVQSGDDAFAGSLSGVLRHHIMQWEKTSLFLDVSFGVFEASDDVPPGGTRFNFVSRAGLGVTRRLNAHTHLMAGARYWHLSNARIEGSDRNPASNGIELNCGLTWVW